MMASQRSIKETQRSTQAESGRTDLLLVGHSMVAGITSYGRLFNWTSMSATMPIRARGERRYRGSRLCWWRP